MMIAKQAIVVGAGMGGLTAAAALAPWFEQVLVLDADVLRDDAADRAGVPQGKHVHLLLAGGQQALNTLFPGFEQELARAGAVPMRVGLDLRSESVAFTPFPQRDLGFHAYAMSRPLLELITRRRLQAIRNIELRQRCRVQAVLPRDGEPAVGAVRYEDEHGNIHSVGGDLVVDASGRGTLTLRLLEQLGHPVPDETTIGVDLNYATAVFEIPPDVPRDWQAVFTLPGPDGRGALLAPLEGNRWILTLGGRHSVKPPGDEVGFMTFAHGLRTRTIFEAIRHAKRHGDIARFGFSVSVYRHYARLPAFPRGLVPTADAVCRFNPVYGQGMSVAAQEACALGRLLEARAGEPDPLEGLATAFLAEADPLIETPWMSAAIPDFVHPETRGQRPENLEQMLKFGLALNRLAARDPAVHRLMAEVSHLLKPRSVYRDPVLVQRVMAEMAE